MKFSYSDKYLNIIESKESEKDALTEETLKANFLPYDFSTEDKIFSLQDKDLTKNLDENTDKSNYQINYFFNTPKKNTLSSTQGNKLPLKPKRLRAAKIRVRNEEGHNFLTIKNELLYFLKKKPKVFVCVFPHCEKAYSSYYKWHTHHRIHVSSIRIFKFKLILYYFILRILIINVLLKFR